MPKKNGYCLLVLASIRRYSNFISSLPITYQDWESYHSDQINFVANLNQKIQSKIIIRCLKRDFGCQQVKRWKSLNKKFVIDDGNVNIKKLIKKSRIFVATYNATTFLESLADNFPTIIFWDPKFWEIKEEALFYFKKLERVGIFHHSYESASIKLNEIWNDIDSWWNTIDLQKARREFCDVYANKNEKSMNKLAYDIKNCIKNYN